MTNVLERKWKCIRCKDPKTEKALITTWVDSLGLRSCPVKSHFGGVKFDFETSQSIWTCCSKPDTNSTPPCARCDHTPEIIVLKPTLTVSLAEIRKYKLDGRLSLLSKPFDSKGAFSDGKGGVDESISFCEIRLYDKPK